MKKVTLEDSYLSTLAELVVNSRLSAKTEVQRELQPYWSFMDDIASIDGTDIKGRRIIIPTSLKDKVINQVHSNYIGIGKA